MDSENISRGADLLVQRLTNAMAVDGAIYAESVLCAMGCVAGYACQADVRSEYLLSGGNEESAVFDIYSDKSGRHYYFGELTDRLLIGEGLSLWGMVSRVSAGLPDINEIMKYVSSAAGSKKFGVVRNCTVGDDMFSYLKMLWQPMSELAIPYCEAGGLHVVFGAALAKLVKALSAQGVDTKESVRIAMESAVSMSRVDIRETWR